MSVNAKSKKNNEDNKDRNTFSLVVSLKTEDGLKMNSFLDEVAKDEKIGTYLKRLVREDMKRKENKVEENDNYHNHNNDVTTLMLKNITLMLEKQGLQLDKIFDGNSVSFVSNTTSSSDNALSDETITKTLTEEEEEEELVRKRAIEQSKYTGPSFGGDNDVVEDDFDNSYIEQDLDDDNDVDEDMDD